MQHTLPPPSGQQVELVLGDQHAVVVEVGGGLRSYTAGGESVLDGYAADAMCDGGRGQVLMPWPNRLADGRYEYQGQTLQLPLTEPARHNANHGLVRWLNWQIAEQQADRVTVLLVLHPQPGYPFTLLLGIHYRLTNQGLLVRSSATNLGASPAPFGAGQHPYLTVGTPLVDEAELRLPAHQVLVADERGIPTGLALDVQSMGLDPTAFRPIGDARLDHCFTGFHRDPDGLARVTLRDPASRRAATLWMDSAYDYLMAFTGDTLPSARRRTGLALEPMTCPPNAFQSGEGLRHLQPGETFGATWGIDPFVPYDGEPG